MEIAGNFSYKKEGEAVICDWAYKRDGLDLKTFSEFINLGKNDSRSFLFLDLLIF